MKSTVISIVFSCQFVTLPNNHFLLMVFISIDLVCFNTALSRIYIHTKKVAAAAPRIVRDHHHYLPFIRHLRQCVATLHSDPSLGSKPSFIGYQNTPFLISALVSKWLFRLQSFNSFFYKEKKNIRILNFSIFTSPIFKNHNLSKK